MTETGLDKPRISELEFVLLTAFLMALVALSIDMMLPALPLMSADLGLEDQNDIQLVISVLFLGMTLAQFFYGPIADRIGRKPTVAIGILIFFTGSVICTVTDDFTVMLLGRLVQGIGVAAMRVVVIALVRDQYEELPMARIISLSMSAFILVPCIAPLMGQAVLAIAHWRAIFGIFAIISVFMLAWFWIRQVETLAVSARIPINLESIAQGVKETCYNDTSLRFTLAAGLVNGAFVGFLVSCAQIFLGIYMAGNKFALYFGVLSISMGAAFLLNARFVRRFGTRKLSFLSLLMTAISSAVLLVIYLVADANPGLWIFMTAMLFIFFFIGFAFGNLSAIAMYPLGHVAGIAASTQGVISGVVTIIVCSIVGFAYNDSILPLTLGFLLANIAAMVIIKMPGTSTAAESKS